MELCKLEIRLESLEKNEGALTEDQFREKSVKRCGICPDNPDKEHDCQMRERIIER